MIWFTSDEHYYHHNMLLFRHNGARPFKTTDAMHTCLKNRHNEVVAPDDTVYHLGDFAYGPGAKSWNQVGELVRKLNGKHHLILGNHDHLKPFDYVEAGFISVHTSLEIPIFPYGTATLIHDPAVAGVLKDRLFIHGHTHSIGKRLSPNTYCVCVELTDYYPVPISDITFGTVEGGDPSG